MDLKNKIKEDFYFGRLSLAYLVLKGSKEDEQDLNLINLLFTYSDTVFCLGRTIADELMQSVILYNNLEDQSNGYVPED